MWGAWMLAHSAAVTVGSGFLGSMSSSRVCYKMARGSRSRSRCVPARRGPASPARRRAGYCELCARCAPGASATVREIGGVYAERRLAGSPQAPCIIIVRLPTFHSFQKIKGCRGRLRYGNPHSLHGAQGPASHLHTRMSKGGLGSQH
eukprot:2027015-Prymnesium_polylepis.1